MFRDKSRSRRIESLQRIQRTPSVAKFAVVVIFDDYGAGAQCPIEQLSPAAQR